MIIANIPWNAGAANFRGSANTITNASESGRQFEIVFKMLEAINVEEVTWGILKILHQPLSHSCRHSSRATV